MIIKDTKRFEILSNNKISIPWHEQTFNQAKGWVAGWESAIKNIKFEEVANYLSGENVDYSFDKDEDNYQEMALSTKLFNARLEDVLVICNICLEKSLDLINKVSNRFNENFISRWTRQSVIIIY